MKCKPFRTEIHFIVAGKKTQRLLFFDHLSQMWQRPRAFLQSLDDRRSASPCRQEGPTQGCLGAPRLWSQAQVGLVLLQASGFVGLWAFLSRGFFESCSSNGNTPRSLSQALWLSQELSILCLGVFFFLPKCSTFLFSPLRCVLAQCSSLSRCF